MPDNCAHQIFTDGEAQVHQRKIVWIKLVHWSLFVAVALGGPFINIFFQLPAGVLIYIATFGLAVGISVRLKSFYDENDLTELDSKQYKETGEMLVKLAQLQPMFATAIQQGRKLRGRDYYFVTEQFGKFKAEQEIEGARERILGLKLKL